MALGAPSRSVAILVAASFAIAAATPSAGSPMTEREGLLHVQSRLDRLALVTNVATGAWMGLQATVKPALARIWALRHEIRAGRRHPVRNRALLVALRLRLAREVAALAPLMPTWLAVKAVLHRTHRSIEAVLLQARRMLRRVLGANPGGADPERWLRRWPVHRDRGGPIEVCPVAGPSAFVDSFGAPRPGGRTHVGEDLLTARGMPVLAVQAGTVQRAQNSLGGRAVLLYDRTGGHEYYAHFSAYGATGRVETGDVIGYAGTSGSARGLIPHVHFEYHPPGQGPVDTFRALREVC